MYDWRKGVVGLEEDLDDEWNEHHESEANTFEAKIGSRKLSQFITKMLAGLPKLEELDVDLETAHTCIDGRNPEPLGGKDLASRTLSLFLGAIVRASADRLSFQISMLTFLSSNATLRVLRMSDSRALPLSDALLQDLPAIPKSLEVLKWNMGEAKASGHECVYLLRRDGNRVKAVQQNGVLSPHL